MAVRTTVFRIFDGSAAINQWVTQYTCPADRTAILKTILLKNGSGVTVYAIVAVRRGASYAQVALNTALPASGLLTGPPSEVVLTPGDSLAIYLVPSTGSSGVITMYASGSLLYGVAV